MKEADVIKQVKQDKYKLGLWFCALLFSLLLVFDAKAVNNQTSLLCDCPSDNKRNEEEDPRSAQSLYSFVFSKIDEAKLREIWSKSEYLHSILNNACAQSSRAGVGSAPSRSFQNYTQSGVSVNSIIEKIKKIFGHRSSGEIQGLWMDFDRFLSSETIQFSFIPQHSSLALSNIVAVLSVVHGLSDEKNLTLVNSFSDTQVLVILRVLLSRLEAFIRAPFTRIIDKFGHDQVTLEDGGPSANELFSEFEFLLDNIITLEDNSIYNAKMINRLKKEDPEALQAIQPVLTALNLGSEVVVSDQSNTVAEQHEKQKNIALYMQKLLQEQQKKQQQGMKKFFLQNEGKNLETNKRLHSLIGLYRVLMNIVLVSCQNIPYFIKDEIKSCDAYIANIYLMLCNAYFKTEEDSSETALQKYYEQIDQINIGVVADDEELIKQYACYYLRKLKLINKSLNNELLVSMIKLFVDDFDQKDLAASD